jgi:hypothetical protein
VLGAAVAGGPSGRGTTGVGIRGGIEIFSGRAGIVGARSPPGGVAGGAGATGGGTGRSG